MCPVLSTLCGKGFRQRLMPAETRIFPFNLGNEQEKTKQFWWRWQWAAAASNKARKKRIASNETRLEEQQFWWRWQWATPAVSKTRTTILVAVAMGCCCLEQNKDSNLGGGGNGLLLPRTKQKKKRIASNETRLLCRIGGSKENAATKHKQMRLRKIGGGDSNVATAGIRADFDGGDN